MSWSSYTHIIHRRAGEQIDPPSRLGQVNEVMRFCVVKKRDGMSVKAVSASGGYRVLLSPRTYLL